AVEIAAQSAPAGVPAVPLGKTPVALVCVIGFRVIVFGLQTLFAAIEGGKNVAPAQIVHTLPRPLTSYEYRAALRI
ncbi:MAG: hypothetical protein DMG97_10830, partial [Acidobacteria bacterium]